MVDFLLNTALLNKHFAVNMRLSYPVEFKNLSIYTALKDGWCATK